MAVSVVPGEAICTLQETGLLRVLVPTEWESEQSALWFPFGSLSFAFFPWKSCVGWRRPWCGVRRNLDATKPEQSDLFPDVLNGNWVVPYWNIYLYFLWAGNLQLADTHLISGLQLSSGYLLFFQVWVCFKSSSSLFFVGSSGSEQLLVHMGRSGEHWRHNSSKFRIFCLELQVKSQLPEAQKILQIHCDKTS